jgi:hypothetical protein
MAGYSGTPLWKKLGLKDGMRATVLHPPENYIALLADAPAAIWGPVTDNVAFVHVFTPFRAELEQTLTDVLRHMARDGMIWVSWPKKASRRPTDITEDTIREVALPLGLVDVKVCAVDDVWSGLKLVIRKTLR